MTDMRREIERIAQFHGKKIADASFALHYPHMEPGAYAEYIKRALTEVSRLAYQEAAEVEHAFGGGIQGVTDWGKGYKQGVRDYAAAILRLGELDR